MMLKLPLDISGKGLLSQMLVSKQVIFGDQTIVAVVPCTQTVKTFLQHLIIAIIIYMHLAL